jgi:hypothetical protein
VWEKSRSRILRLFGRDLKSDKLMEVFELWAGPNNDLNLSSNMVSMLLKNHREMVNWLRLRKMMTWIEWIDIRVNYVSEWFFEVSLRSFLIKKLLKVGNFAMNFFFSKKQNLCFSKNVDFFKNKTNHSYFFSIVQKAVF